MANAVLVAGMLGLGGAGLGGCAGPPVLPPQTASQRFNAEGLRRLARGELPGAEEMFGAAQREAELIDDLAAQAEARNNLGAVAMARDEARVAWRHHAAAIEFYRSLGRQDAGLMRSHANLGAAMLAAGAPDQASGEFRAALQLAIALGEPQALALVGLASVELQRGRFADALRLAQGAGEAARLERDRSSEAGALAVEGAAQEGRGRPAEARRAYEAALAIDREREEPSGVRQHLRALVRVLEAGGELANAARHLLRAARVSRLMGQLETSVGELDHVAALVARLPQSAATDAALLGVSLAEERALLVEAQANQQAGNRNSARQGSN